MNLANDKALAARRLRSLADRNALPECVVLDVWRGLERSLETARSEELERLVLSAFLRDLEERVACRLAHDLNTTSAAGSNGSGAGCRTTAAAFAVAQAGSGVSKKTASVAPGPAESLNRIERNTT